MFVIVFIRESGRMFAITELSNEELHLPTRNQVIVNKDFLGKGHHLESKRRQRRTLDQKHRSLSNEVSLLEKKCQKSNREILKQQRELEYIVGVRQKQHLKEEQKARQRSQREEQLTEMRAKFLSRKIVQQKQVGDSVSGLLENNHTQYIQQRNTLSLLKSQLREDMRKDLQKKMNTISTVNHDKYLGLMRMVDYKSHKNKKSLQHYNQKVREEEERIQVRKQQMELLEELKSNTAEVLGKRSQLTLGLKEVLDHAYSVDLDSLEQNFKQFKTRTKKTLTLSPKTNKSLFNKSVASSYQHQTPRKHSQTSKQQRINHTIDLVQRSDIFSIIKMVDNPEGTQINKKKRKRRSHSKRKKSQDSYVDLMMQR